MPVAMASRVVRPDGIMAAQIDQELVILNMAKNNYVSLDTIGRRIWELIEEPVSVADLCLQLGQEFNGNDEEIAADVLQFLNQLEMEGLVRVAD